MTSRSRWSVLALSVLGVALALPLRASADAESCTQAHATGQREENAGHLKDALLSFRACASDAQCPLPIRNECTNLYTTVEGRLPTLVFSVVDEGGNDVNDVRVSSADALIVSGLDGRPIAVNPGLHEFRFELPGGQTLTKSVVVRQGEKDRIVALKLPRSDFGAAPVSAGGEAAAESSQSGRRYTVPLASWVAFGVGGAALVSWGTFALLGRNQEKELVDCSPSCQPERRDDYDAMKRNYLIADVSLGVAAAAAIAGTVMVFTMGKRKPEGERLAGFGPKRALSLAPTALGRVGGGLVLQGRY